MHGIILFKILFVKRKEGRECVFKIKIRENAL